MMRALWTSASGMTAQQVNVDTISNNLSNVNTTGYKKERMEFKSLLYETMQRADQDPANIGSRAVNLQVGHGVRSIATARLFDQGNVTSTSNPTDFAIEGNGFFTIQRGENDIAYSKDGSFKISVMDTNELMLVSSEGFPVLDVNGDTILFDEDMNISTIAVDRDGSFSYMDTDGQLQDMDVQLNIVQFSNLQGLEAIGNNLFRETSASGIPLSEADGETVTTSAVIQRYLERSNVSVADEMVDLIVAQRAYELNSKCIQAADDMLQNANNLKR